MLANRHRLLLLDQSGSAANRVQRSLEQAGCAVDLVYDAATRMAEVVPGRYDLILLNPLLLRDTALETTQQLLVVLAAPVIIVVYEPIASGVLERCGQVEPSAFFWQAGRVDDLSPLVLLVEQTIRRHRAWQMLQQEQQRLTAQISEQATQIRALTDQRDLLQQQNEALDTYAHSVAHDLKNPLTLIVGFADLLRDGMATMPTESIHESLATIVEYSVKMSHIVDALLMLASVGKDEEVEREALDMGEIIVAVLRRIEHMVREYEAEVVGPVEWPPVLGYRMWLEEVWFNYLSNAIKYGGRPPRLMLGFDQPADGVVRFFVDDNGDGLPVDDPMALFLPQPRRQRPANVDGHGLGLSIVQRIINRLGGAVGAERIDGGGSRFSFTLPLASTAANKE
jgi:signal transduction histidine kinase